MGMTKSEESAAVLANMDIVRKLARKYSTCGVDMVDLVQEGTIGLIRGMRKWSPEGGASLRTYTSRWIESYIRRAVGTESREGKLTVRPETISLDAPLAGCVDGCLHDVLPDSSENPEEIASRNERVQMTLDAMIALQITPCEILIVKENILQEERIDTLMETTGLSRARVYQLKNDFVDMVSSVAKAAS